MHQQKKQQDLLNLQKAAAQRKHFDMFWGNDGGEPKTNKWESWLREKGLLPGGDDHENEPTTHGWTDPNDDLSEIEDDAWVAGGIRRPGEKDSEEFTTEEEMGDDWADDDDDDHGGQMMPIPSM